MNTYLTKTHEFGEVTFSAPAATETKSGYVWMERANGKRQQICYGGDFLGTTVTATAVGLKKTAQTWLRQRRDWQRKVREA